MKHPQTRSRSRSHPKLPSSIRGSWLSGLNRGFLASFTGVALVQLGFISYLRTLDPPRVDPVPDGFLDRIAQAPLMPLPRPPLDPAHLAQSGEQPIKVEAKRVNKWQHRRSRSKNSRSGHRVDPARRIQFLKKQVSTLGLLAILGAKARDGRSRVPDLIRAGRPDADTDRIFSGVSGLTVSSRSTALKHLRRGSRRSKVVGIDALVVRGPGEVKTGRPVRERIPKALVDPAVDKIRTCLPFDEVTRVIRRGMQAVRSCYQRGLRRDPDLAGKLTLRLSLNTMGRVVEISVETDSVDDTGVTSCITRRAQRWRFPPSKDRDAEVAVPFLLRPAGR